MDIENDQFEEAWNDFMKTNPSKRSIIDLLVNLMHKYPQFTDPALKAAEKIFLPDINHMEWNKEIMEIVQGISGRNTTVVLDLIKMFPIPDVDTCMLLMTMPRATAEIKEYIWDCFIVQNEISLASLRQLLKGDDIFLAQNAAKTMIDVFKKELEYFDVIWIKNMHPDLSHDAQTILAQSKYNPARLFFSTIGRNIE